MLCVTWQSLQSRKGRRDKVSAQRRGGGEYGNEWWQDGHLLKKQNSFDDFASCAEFLNNAKYTSPAKLTIQVGTCACSYNGF